MDQEHLNLNHARVDAQRLQMEKIARRGVCPFCREHFEEYHEAPILYETPYWLVSNNDFPYEGTVRHFLIVAIRHVMNPSDLGALDFQDLGFVLGWIAHNFPYPGGTFLMRFGDTNFTGATISHLHAHVVYGVSAEEGTEAIKQKVGYQKK